MWKLVFISQHKKNYAFAIFNQFIVSLSASALTHSVSTTFIEYKCQPPGRGGGGGATTPAVQLNSIFSAKTDPRENPEKKPDNHLFEFVLAVALPSYILRSLFQTQKRGSITKTSIFRKNILCKNSQTDTY